MAVLVLASASPRRQELLRNAGIAFITRPTNIPEVPLKGENPSEFVARMAWEKTLAVFHENPNDFVLGADTIVIVDGEILGKPREEADAARMLRLLSGRKHQVTTAVCLAGPLGASNREPKTGFEDKRSETTSVTVAKLSEEDICSYIATREPMDKAGAYGIQGVASRWISRIEGDYFNVVGLPVALVYRMLKEHRAF
jgi:septum formation protein